MSFSLSHGLFGYHRYTSVARYDSLAELEAVHGHDRRTRAVSIKGEPVVTLWATDDVREQSNMQAGGSLS